MTPEAVFLLAYGQQTRIAAQLCTPKQLVEITKDERILDRTVRQVKAAWPEADITLVAPDEPVWREFVAQHDLRHLQPLHRGETVVETIAQLLIENSLLLLGDVVFSDEAFRIMSGTHGLAVFARNRQSAITARPAEFFGLSVPFGDADRVYEALDDVKRGRLRELHARIRGCSLVEIDDFTDDVDSPEDLGAPLDAIRWAIVAENDGVPFDRKLVDAKRFWEVAATFPPNKEEVYPEHAIAHEFDKIQPGMQVLEYGCGGGSDTMSFLRRGARVYAADIVQANLQMTHRRAFEARLSGNLCLVHLDQSDQILLADDSIDIASAHGVLHHIPTPLVERTIKEIYRVLKPGGVLYSMLYTPALELHLTDKIMEFRAATPGLTHEEAFGWATDGKGCPFAEAYDEMKATATFGLCGFELLSRFTYHQGFFTTWRWRKP